MHGEIVKSEPLEFAAALRRLSQRQRDELFQFLNATGLPGADHNEIVSRLKASCEMKASLRGAQKPK
jgi:hypothetical protein